MYELLNFLSLYIPNLGEVIGSIGAALVIVGLLNVFLGYKLFRLVLAIIGFLVGAAAGFAAFYLAGNGSVGVDSYILIGGIIGSLVVEFFQKVGVFLVVGAMGVIVAYLTTQDAQSSLILGIICGVAGVFLEKYVIIVTTSLSGGALTATGIWFVGLSNRQNTNTLVIGWVIGIVGIWFQLWLEKKKPKKTEGSDKESRFEFINDIKSKLENVDPSDVKSIAVKALLGLPVIVGIILGNLFKSSLSGFGVITALYVLVMLQFIRKRKADVSPGEFTQRFGWEKWVNKVLDNNVFVVFVPLIPGCFIWALLGTFINGTLSFILALLGTVGIYILYFKALPGDKPKESPPSPVSVNNNQTEPQSGTATVEASQYCPNCGFALTKDSVFCSECGAKVQVTETAPEFVFCSKCGTKLPSDAAFCRKCGTPIVNNNASQQAHAEPDKVAGQSPSQPSATATSVEPKKKSKKLFFGIAGIVVIAVAVIIIALNWGGKTDYVLTVKAHRPFVSQGLSYTYGTVLNDYIDSPIWEVRNVNDMIFVSIRGKAKSTGSIMLVSINVIPDPNNPDMASISPAFITVDNVRTNTRNEAVEYLLDIFFAYDEGQSGTPTMSQSYDQTRRLDLNSADEYFYRGYEYTEKGDYDQAITDYTQVIRLEPNHAYAYYNRAWLYARKGDYDRAITDYTQAIQLELNDADTYYQRGEAYFNKGDYDSAIADFEAALRIDPNNAEAKRDLEAARQQWESTSSQQLQNQQDQGNANFPSSFFGTWKRDNFNNTLTFTANTLKASNQSGAWNLKNVSGDLYTIKLPANSYSPVVNIRLVSGNLVISGDSGEGQNNWNGTWRNQGVAGQAAPPLTSFIGTWITNNNYQTIVLTNNEFRISDTDGDFFYFAIDYWIAASNINRTYSVEYPLGYRLTGRISGNKNYDYNGTTLYVFLNSNGRNLLWFTSDSYSSSTRSIFSKR